MLRFCKIIIAIVAFFSLVGWVGMGTNTVTRTSKHGVTSLPPAPGDAILWDSTGDKILWDASGDVINWS